MSFRRRHEEYNNSNVQECSEYTPIQAANLVSLEFDAAEIEDAGCDSCTHYHNGECGVFHSNNKGDAPY
jgi:hypothetical protein